MRYAAVFHLAPQPSFQAGAPERNTDARLLAVALREPDKGRLQAQIVEDGRPEVEGEVVYAMQQLDGEFSRAPAGSPQPLP